MFLLSEDGVLVTENLNGLVGLGKSDIDGSFGFSIFEEFLSNGVIDIPFYSICVEPDGNGYIYFSAYTNGTNSFDYN